MSTTVATKSHMWDKEPGREALESGFLLQVLAVSEATEESLDAAVDADMDSLRDAVEAMERQGLRIALRIHQARRYRRGKALEDWCRARIRLGGKPISKTSVHRMAGAADLLHRVIRKPDERGRVPHAGLLDMDISGLYALNAITDDKQLMAFLEKTKLIERIPRAKLREMINAELGRTVETGDAETEEADADAKGQLELPGFADLCDYERYPVGDPWAELERFVGCGKRFTASAQDMEPGDLDAAITGLEGALADLRRIQAAKVQGLAMVDGADANAEGSDDEL